jgi:hypothetical protein
MGAVMTEDGPVYRDCNGFTLATEDVLNSLSIGAVGGSGYNKTFKLATDVKTQSYTQSSGLVSQPATTGRDITVNTYFMFRGGTLNSSGSLANVKLDSAEAYITPYGEGSVTLGSNLRPEDGTNLTISPGTVNLSNVARILATDSTITVPLSATGNPTILAGQPQLGNPPNRLSGATGQLTISNSFRSDTPWLVDGATLKIINERTAEFKGNVAGAGTVSLELSGTTGKIQIENGSTLKVQNGVSLTGGKLSTLVGAAVTTTATIDGKVMNSGADVVICDGSTPHVYGRLSVIGEVSFTGGTYRPVVNAGENGIADRWTSTGNFTVGGAAKLEIRALNIPQAGPVAGGIWVIIESTTGTVAGVSVHHVASSPPEHVPGH